MSLKSLIEKMDTLTGASIVLNEGEDSNLSNSLKATVGDVEVHYEPAGSSGGILKVLKSGEEIADGDYDRGAGLYFVNVPGKKGQKPFDSCKEIAEFFANKNLDEDTKETPSGRVHKAKPGGYGRQFDTDIEGNEVGTPLKQIVKRGRGRPRKDADSTGYVPKYEFATALQGWMVGNLPKGGLPGKPGVKHKLKDWMERVESAMLTEGYIAEGQMSEVYTILQDLAANGDIREAERLMTNPKGPVEEYAGNVLMDYLDMVAAENSSASESDLGAMLMRKVDDEFGDTLEEVAGVINLPPTRVGGSQTQTNTVSVDGKAPAQASQQSSSNSTTALKITDPALMGLENIIQTALDKGSIKQLGEGAVNKFKSIVDSYPHEHKMCQEGWGMHESLYQALCDHYWGEGRIPHDKMYGDSQELRDWVEECYMEDAQQLNENPLVGAAVRGFASGAGAAMADRLLGDSMENMLDEMENKSMKEGAFDRIKGALGLNKTTAPSTSSTKNVPSGIPKIEKMLQGFDPAMYSNIYVTLPGSKSDNAEHIQKYFASLGNELKYSQGDYADVDYTKVETSNAKLFIPLIKSYISFLKNTGADKTVFAMVVPTPVDKQGVAEGRVDEKLTKSMTAGEIISDFVGSENPKFDGKSKKERTKMALGAYYGMHPEKSKKKANESVDEVTAEGFVDKMKGAIGMKPVNPLGPGYTQGHAGRGPYDNPYGLDHYDENQFLAATGLTPQQWDLLDPWDKRFIRQDRNLLTTWKHGGIKKYQAEIQKYLNSAEVKARTRDPNEVVHKHDETETDRIRGYTEGVAEGGLNKHAKDPQMEAWARELDTLLNEGLTLTTSTGQPGGSDSVSVSATDEDAKTLMKLIQDAGLMKAQSGSMSLPAADNPAITIEPVSQDEVMGTLEPADDDSGDGAMSFLKRMLGARGEHGGHSHDQHGDYEQEEGEECGECGHADCQCDHAEVDEMHNQAASSGDATQDVLPEEEMEEGNLFTGNLAKARAAGKKEADLDGDGDMEKVKETSQAPQAPVSNRTLYEPVTGPNGLKGQVPSKKAKETSQAPQAPVSNRTLYEPVTGPNELKGQVPIGRTDEEALDQPATMESERCDECGGVMESDHKCGGADEGPGATGEKYGIEAFMAKEEKLDEWANSPGGKSADEAFLADLTFMTKTLSGGLNNIKQDQTTVPSARVKSEERNVETSMAELMRKLQNIN